jgi:predicted RNA-binding Zn-ribbon protein involved in translation (DUF1610 family)
MDSGSRTTLAAVTTEAKFACPVCGQLTLDEEPPGTFDICGVCGWEDDAVQFRDPDFRGGANQKSLNEARARWEKRLDRRRG